MFNVNRRRNIRSDSQQEVNSNQKPTDKMAGLNRNSYYNRNWGQSESLIRARRPYLFKNTVLGLGLLLFTAGIYTYTLRAVGQDEFEDVKVPDAPISRGQSVIRGSKAS